MHRYISQASMVLLTDEDHRPSGPAGADPPALEGALADARKSTT